MNEEKDLKILQTEAQRFGQCERILRFFKLFVLFVELFSKTIAALSFTTQKSRFFKSDFS